MHVAAAFQFVHHWSHAEAVRFTAEQTARMIGLRSGSGIYLNYLLMLVWGGDCAYWWIAGSNAYHRRSGGVSVALHAFLLFMMFNATVVFATGATRYVAIVVVACLGLVWLAKRKETKCDRRR